KIIAGRGGPQGIGQIEIAATADLVVADLAIGAAEFHPGDDIVFGEPGFPGGDPAAGDRGKVAKAVRGCKLFGTVDTQIALYKIPLLVVIGRPAYETHEPAGRVIGLTACGLP